MKTAFDKFMIEEIVPSIRQALIKEDILFKKQIKNSIHTDFYKEYSKGISSSILTERTLQYVIFKKLCKEFKVLPEDLAYGNSNERLDLSIYKNIKDSRKFAEIGIELKQVSFTNEGKLYQKSLKNLISDFDKLKKAGNKNKYIILLGLYHKKKIDHCLFNEYIISSIDNRKFKKFRLELISQKCFKTEGFKNKNFYLINLLKLKQSRSNYQDKII